jgi:hypothetical protein
LASWLFHFQLENLNWFSIPESLHFPTQSLSSKQTYSSFFWPLSERLFSSQNQLLSRRMATAELWQAELGPLKGHDMQQPSAKNLSNLVQTKLPISTSEITQCGARKLTPTKRLRFDQDQSLIENSSEYGLLVYKVAEILRESADLINGK